MPQMGLNETESDGQAVMRLSGRLDIDTAPRLRKALRRHLEGQDEGLVLDLAGLDYMDTSGLATVIEMQREMEARERRLVLSALQPQVLEVLHMNHMDQAFEMVENESEAVERLKQAE